MNSKFLSRSALCLALTLGACSNQQEPAPEDTATQQSTPAISQQQAPAASSPEDAVLSGKVLETMNAAGYTYLLVDTGINQTWVAVMETPVSVGDEVSYYQGMIMTNFVSNSLNRTFDSIVFSKGLVGNASAGQKKTVVPQKMLDKLAAAPVAKDMEESFADAVKAEGSQEQIQPESESGGSLAAIATFASVSVPKATGENAQVVGDIFTNKAQLDGTKVQIQGQVIKFSPMIMGKNWIHLQDGSGDPLQNSHDLVVTTNESPAEGDVITIEGIVRADQDFGFGYKYDVLIEEAVIITQ